MDRRRAARRRGAARCTAMKFGALPVVRDGRLVGILTDTDLLRCLVDLLARGGLTATRGRGRRDLLRRLRAAVRRPGGGLVPATCRRASPWTLLPPLAARQRPRRGRRARPAHRARCSTPGTTSRCTAAPRPAGGGTAAWLDGGRARFAGRRPAARAVARARVRRGGVLPPAAPRGGLARAGRASCAGSPRRAVLVDYPTRRSVNAVGGAAVRREEGRGGRHAAVHGVPGRGRRGGVRGPRLPRHRAPPRVLPAHGPSPGAGRGPARPRLEAAARGPGPRPRARARRSILRAERHDG